jgi:hypothetical protein
VLLSVTVPPQVVIASIHQVRQNINYFSSQSNRQEKFFVLTNATDFSKDARTARSATKKGTDRSWSTNSGVTTRRSASIEVGQWTAKIGIHGNRNSIGKAGEGPPRICRGESIVKEAGVDQIGTQSTKSKTTFWLVVFFVAIICLDSFIYFARLIFNFLQ